MHSAALWESASKMIDKKERKLFRRNLVLIKHSIGETAEIYIFSYRNFVFSHTAVSLFCWLRFYDFVSRFLIQFLSNFYLFIIFPYFLRFSKKRCYLPLMSFGHVWIKPGSGCRGSLDIWVFPKGGFRGLCRRTPTETPVALQLIGLTQFRQFLI